MDHYAKCKRKKRKPANRYAELFSEEQLKPLLTEFIYISKVSQALAVPAFKLERFIKDNKNLQAWYWQMRFDIKVEKHRAKARLYYERHGKQLPELAQAQREHALYIGRTVMLDNKRAARARKAEYMTENGLEAASIVDAICTSESAD